MDTPEDVVFKIHHGGVFFFDPLRYEQGQVTIMKACSTNRLRFNELCNILVLKLQEKIWAVFWCIPELDIDGGGLKIIERDSDLQVVYDMAKNQVDEGGTSAEPQPRQARARAQPLPVMMKSQRILQKRLSAPVTGPGSSMEDEIVFD